MSVEPINLFLRTFFTKYKRIIVPIMAIIGIIIFGTFYASYSSVSPFMGILTILGILFGVYVFFRFIVFFQGDERMNQKFNQFHGQHFLSSFYRIYFPVVIVGFALQIFLQFALIPPEFGGLGLLDYQEISPSLMIRFTILSFAIAVGTMALSDYEMKKNSLFYSAKVGKTSYFRGLGYVLPLTGLYFGAVFLVNFTIEVILGPGILIPQQNVSFEPDEGVNRAAKFWDLSTDNEKFFILITFILVYISMEVLLRGFIARQGEGYQLGPAGIVFIPAILQATAFTSGMTVFTDPVFYAVTVFDALLLGTILGIALWRTGNFAVVITTALFTRLMDTRIEFQTVVLHMLPENFGEYNPLDGVNTLADTLGEYLIYSQVALVAISPFILIVSYEEVGKVLKALYKGLKEQWFGLLALAVAFILIDLIFSLVTSFVGAFIGFFLGLLVIGFVLRIFFRILPEPTEMPVLHTKTDMFDGELPVNLKKDLEYLETRNNWFDQPIRNGIIGGGAFIYFLFLSAAYRQYTTLDLFGSIQYTIFLVILPMLIIGISTYLISRAYKSGFFFAETWRGTLLLFSIGMFILNIFIWTDITSRVQFSWRALPLSVVFLLLIWSKPVENPVRDLALGFARDGRYATFRFIKKNPEVFVKNFEDLRDLPSDNIKIGSFIMASQLEMLNPKDLVESLRNRKEMERGEIIGKLLALGIIRHSAAEGVLLDILTEEDIDYKMAAYWSLGYIGSDRALRRMAKILEENPKKELVPIAETAILNIDPNYPLAGIRDSIQIQT